MSAIIQISDPHFGTEQPPVVEALLELVRKTRPELAVLSGDITQRARRAQFEAAGRFVERMNVPSVVAIPGNHDIPLFNVAARALYPYENYKRVFGEELEPQFESDEFLVLCVNTTRPARHKDGEVSKEQVERVAQRLRSAGKQQVRIVVTHQPVHVVRESDISNRLHGYELAVRSWGDAGADIILGGHIHLPYIASLPQSVPELRRRCWAVQAGTAVSTRIRELIPNSVNVIRREAHVETGLACRLERWDFDPASGNFHCVQAHALQLDRSS